MVKCVSCAGDNAIYGKKGGKKEYCINCAKNIEGLANLTRKHCKFEDCIKEPNYNYIGAGTGIYCGIHRLDGMEDVKHKKCEYIDENDVKCKSIPTYGPEGGKAIYCEPHSHNFENMILIRNDLCKYKDENGEKCNSRASYNLPGNKMGKWCEKHKGEDDIFVISYTKCSENGCNITATQNYKNQKKPLYCEAHKKIGMINIADPRCEIEECIKMATHAGEDGIKRFCGEHKQENMKNIRSKKCAFEGCEKEPSQNIPGIKIRLFCAEHADKTTMENIKNPKCKRCKDKEAICNFKGLKERLYCTRCKDYNMIQLTGNTCKNGDCLTRATKKYKGYCRWCFVHLFPNEPIAKNFKTKEKAVYDYIISQFSDIEIIYDKIVKFGTSKRRPDLCIHKDNYNIILEIDENQHIDYEQICENKRTMELFQDLGNKPLVMIRFNPDEYLNEKNEIVKSCWINRSGIMTINNKKKNEWQERLNTLKNSLKYYLDNEPQKDVQIEYLYYDLKKDNICDDNIIIA